MTLLKVLRNVEPNRKPLGNGECKGLLPIRISSSQGGNMIREGEAKVRMKDMTPLQKAKQRNINRWCWLFLLPAFAFYLVFQLYPIFSSIYYSLLNWSGMTKAAQFIGLSNYRELFSDTVYWKAFWNSFLYAVLVVPITLVVSLLIAYILNDGALRLRNMYRTLYFLPVITTTSIIGIVMVFIWGVNGPVSALLTSMGILKMKTNLLGTKIGAFAVLVIVSVWKNMGTYMIYWLAGLQGIPQDLYDASYVDGCGRWQTFRHVVLPQLRSIGAVIALLCFINSLKVFDIVKTMTNGGPFYATEVVGTWVYNKAFSSQMGMPRLGYASAGANMFGFVVIILVAVSNQLKAKAKKNAD